MTTQAMTVLFFDDEPYLHCGDLLELLRDEAEACNDNGEWECAIALDMVHDTVQRLLYRMALRERKGRK